MKRQTLMALAVLAMAAAFGGTYTWKGGSGSYRDAAMWEGGVAPAVGETGVNLVFPASGGTVQLPTSSDEKVASMVLQGGTTEFVFGSSGGTLDVTGVVSGAGALKTTGVSGVNVKSYVHLRGNNTFSGGYYNDGGQTRIYTDGSLGTGSAKFRSNGNPAYPLYVSGACTIPNDMTVGWEAKSGIGCVQNAAAVTFTGNFSFSNAADVTPINNNYNQSNYRLTSSGSALMTFKGNVSLTGGSFILASCNLRFEKALPQISYSYNGAGLVEFAASGNAVTSLDFNSWGSGTATYRLCADNAFLTPPSVSMASGNYAGGNKTLDLNGHDWTVKSISVGIDASHQPIPYITSATPATFTVQNDTADRTVECGRFMGRVTFAFDCPGRTYTITKGQSDCTGLTVKNGTLVVTDAASFSNLTRLEVVPGATLRVTDTAGTIAAQYLVLTSSAGVYGTLDLGGRTVEVSTFDIDGVRQRAGTYTSANCAALASGTTIVVSPSGDYDPDWWVWTGLAGGAWNQPGNWEKGGLVPTSGPDASATLYIGKATASTPFCVTANTTIANPIILGEGQQVIEDGGSKVAITLSGVVSGVGGLNFKSASSGSTLALSGDNTFHGGVLRSGAGTVNLWHVNGLGTGAFRSENPANVSVSYPLSLRTTGTVTNDMSFAGEGGNNGWNGCMGVSVSEVHLSGAIDFRGETRISMNDNSKLYFDGEVTLRSRLTLNQAAEIIFTNPVKGGGYLHTDQGRGTWRLMSTGNAVNTVQMSGGGATVTVFCGAEDVFPASALFQCADSASHNYVFNLNGFDQTLACLYDSKVNVGTQTVRSDAPATLTLCPQGNYTTRFGLAGAVSLDVQAAAGKTYTFALGAHTTTGRIRVSSGTAAFTDGTSVTGLEAFEVASGATLALAASAGTISASQLEVAAGGVVHVDAEQVLYVDQATVAEQGLAAGTYTAANAAWIDGGGSVIVSLGVSDDGTYVWTGAAGGEWYAAGNWSVGGHPATTTPTGDTPLFIGAATPEHPFLATAGVTIPNPITLGSGLQYIKLGFSSGVLEFSGEITGAGGLQFDSHNNAQYYARLSGANNTFMGGVRRSGAGQLQVFHGNALGTGLVTLDHGSMNGSGIPNWTPLYVGQDCTIANDFLVAGESTQSWNGWWGGKAGVTVHFTGDFSFRAVDGGSTQTRFGDHASTLYFDGSVEVGNPFSLICKGGATAYFAQPIRARGGVKSPLWADNGSFVGHLCSSSNQVSALYGGTVSNWRWYLEAKDAIAGGNIYIYGNPGTPGVLVDLCGYDQNIGNLFYSNGPYNDHFCVTSAVPSTLTMHATGNNYFGGRFVDAVSLVYAPTGNFVYTLSNAVHSTTGTLTVAGGTVKLVNGADFPKLTAATVTGGTLQLTEGGRLNRRAALRLNGGMLQLDAGTTTVSGLYFGTSDKSEAGGLWGAPGNSAAAHTDSRITGSGLLQVQRNIDSSVLIFR